MTAAPNSISLQQTLFIVKSASSTKQYILYADDDVDDRYLFESTLSEVSEDVEARMVANGIEVIDLLKSIQPGERLPCFILLDINMPSMDGFSTLAELKNDPVFKSIPVIMYSTSSSEADIRKSLSLGAEQMLTKPFSLGLVQHLVEKFVAYCEELGVQTKR